MNTVVESLPADWSVRRLGDLGDWGSGGTPRRDVRSYYGRQIPWLRISDLNDGVVTAARESLTQEGLRNSSAKVVEPGTLLVAMYGSIGKLGITGMRCATNQAIAFCIPHENLTTTEFLFQLLLHLRPVLVAHGKGGNQSNISQTVLKELEVPLPPLEDQTEIVNSLRALSAQRESSENRLRRVRHMMPQVHEAVLDAATTGELTADWRQKLSQLSASAEIVDSGSNGQTGQGGTHPEDGRSLPDIPATWKWVTLGSISTSVLGKMLDSAKNKGDPLPYLRNVNVRWREFDLSEVLQMPFQPGEEERYGLQPGDVLVCEGGEPGRAAVWREADSDIKFQKALHRIRCESGLHPDWLVNVLEAHARSGVLAGYFTGSGIMHLTGVSLARVPIPLPPIEEQRAIVRRMEDLLGMVGAVTSRVDWVSQLIEQGSRAWLAKAFHGEVEQAVVRSKTLGAT